jgi:hypothetical protein
MGERENKREEQGQAERMLVVGIGASVGGLEALKRFFDHLAREDRYCLRGDDASRARSKASGIDHHLVKPVDTQLIRELLKQEVPDNRLSEVQDGER